MCALPQTKRGLENLASSSSPRQAWEGENERKGEVINNPAFESFTLWLGLFCRPVFAVHIPGGPETKDGHPEEGGGQHLHLTWQTVSHGRGQRGNLWECLELMSKGVAEPEEVLHLVVSHRSSRPQPMVIVCVPGKPQRGGLRTSHVTEFRSPEAT